MNNKGQIGAGGLVMTAIVIIVALAIFSQVDNIVGNSITRVDVDYKEYESACAANGSTQLLGRDGGVLRQVINGSNSNVTSEFSIANRLDENGRQAIYLITSDTAVARNNNCSTMDVYYSYNPDGYMSGGDKTTLYLVLILTAVAVAVIGLRAVQTKF